MLTKYQKSTVLSIKFQMHDVLQIDIAKTSQVTQSSWYIVYLSGNIVYAWVTFAPIIVRLFGLRFFLRFLDIVGDRGLRRMCLQLIGYRTISRSGFRQRSESEPYGDHREIVRKS